MYNIVGALFTTESEAREAMAALSETPQINGVLTGPVGLLLGGAAGALLGKAGEEDKKDESAALIEQAAKKLEEGDIALIALVDETDESILDHAMVKFNTVIVRYDAEVISKELEEAEKMEEEMARQAREKLRGADEN